MATGSSREQGYDGKSVNARLAAALLTMTRVLEREQLTTAELRALVDHLWQWPTIDERLFADWEQWSNDVLAFALGDQPSENFAAAAEQSSLSMFDLRKLIESTVEIVYGNLFAATDHALTLDLLLTVEEIACGRGIDLPPSEVFDGEPADPSLRNGWGGRMTDEQVSVWRSLAW
jgi:hypothetical protein